MSKHTKKRYRLTRGTHQVPNTEYDGASANPGESHTLAVAGDIVELNDDQFRAFHDRFEPAESEASEVRDRDDEALQTAVATAKKTGSFVDPN